MKLITAFIIAGFILVFVPFILAELRLFIMRRAENKRIKAELGRRWSAEKARTTSLPHSYTHIYRTPKGK